MDASIAGVSLADVDLAGFSTVGVSLAAVFYIFLILLDIETFSVLIFGGAVFLCTCFCELFILYASFP